MRIVSSKPVFRKIQSVQLHTEKVKTLDIDKENTVCTTGLKFRSNNKYVAVRRL